MKRVTEKAKKVAKSLLCPLCEYPAVCGTFPEKLRGKAVKLARRQCRCGYEAWTHSPEHPHGYPWEGCDGFHWDGVHWVVT